MRFSVRSKKSESSENMMSLYYASDVHGSEQCWRKFLGAARFYGVDALIMGGDLTGKAIVPITRNDDGAFSATFLGESVTGRSPEGLSNLMEAIRFNGMYPWIAKPEEVALCTDDASARGELFQKVIVDELKRWIALADERLSDLGVDMFVMAGNDDPWICDSVIRSGCRVTPCDERIVYVGEHEMMSCSYANPTPWDSPRELPEAALYDHLKQLAEQLESPKTAIMNLHVPPHNSGIDRAYEIDNDLSVVYVRGQPNEIPVGSMAVREILEEYQPLLSLHGHIHESRGEARLGDTLALNSGSEYNSGRIHGVVASLGPTSVVRYQFVSG
jgi:Icc-related predicted phosphoesterase